jgi:riboflavin kinase/FMN adenylyltransferase
VEAGQRAGLIPTALTFDPHPASVVSTRGAPPRIQTLTSRNRCLREIGIEDLAHLRFDQTISRLSPAEFVDQALVDGVQAGCVVVGHGFRFGASRAGDVETLRALGRDRFETIEVPTLEDGGERVSSSRLREALRRGDLPEARRFLGRPYEIEGRVTHGDHRGRTIGFPTANIDLEGVTALAPGVYAADGFIDGETLGRRAAVNLGVRPTFGGAESRLEAHFPGFDGDLYGRAVRLVFLARLRDERVFDSLEDLRAQLEGDVRTAERLSASPAP